MGPTDCQSQLIGQFGRFSAIGPTASPDCGEVHAGCSVKVRQRPVSLMQPSNAPEFWTLPGLRTQHGRVWSIELPRDIEKLVAELNRGRGSNRDLFHVLDSWPILSVEERTVALPTSQLPMWPPVGLWWSPPVCVRGFRNGGARVSTSVVVKDLDLAVDNHNFGGRRLLALADGLQPLGGAHLAIDTILV